MMASCALPMPLASVPFVRSGRYSLRAARAERTAAVAPATPPPPLS